MSLTSYHRAVQLKALPGVVLTSCLLAGTLAAVPQDPAPSVAFVDAVALDSSNRPVSSLAADDFRVTIDGEVRRVVGIRYVVQGRGAVAAARSLAPTARVPVLANPSRLVVLVVDESSMLRGEEKRAAAGVSRLVDNLAAGDRVSLIALPVVRGDATASTDRDRLRDDLARLTGRATVRSMTAWPEAADVPDRVGGPPDDDPRRERQQETAGQRVEQRRELTEPSGLVDELSPTPRPMASLARLLEGLCKVEGPKLLLLFSGGLDASPDDRDSRAQADALWAAEAAAASRTLVHLVHLPRLGPARSLNAGYERLAIASGGGVTTLSGKSRELELLDGLLAGSYLLEVERRPSDADRRSCSLRVTTPRKDVRVHAAARWTPRNDPLPPPLPPLPSASPRASAAEAPAAAPAPRPRRPVRPDPRLDAVLARVAEYLQVYVREFSNIVAEEDYRQQAGKESRRLKSDFLIVRAKGPIAWVPFRDVFEVDGKPVRDREERLQKLFLTDLGSAMEGAMRITEEGARFNLGGAVYRTVNNPTLALEFLDPIHVSRLAFEHRGEENVQGVRVWRVDFEEFGSPTVIRTEPDRSQDFPATGSLWIEPLTGRIVKTRLRASDERLSAEMWVLYARNDALGMWTPFEMKEIYEYRFGTISGEARYSNFRRFQVTTEETVKVPKDIKS